MHWPCVANRARRDKRYDDWCESFPAYWSRVRARAEERAVLLSIGYRVGPPFSIWTPWEWGSDPYFSGHRGPY